MGHLHLRGRDNLKANLVVIALVFAGALYVLLGSPLYWRLVATGAMGAFGSCPECICDCVIVQAENETTLADLKDVLLPYCGRDDPDMEEELKKSRMQLLQEELKLQDIVLAEAQERNDAAIIEANSKASQHFKKFQRCSVEMLASESGRERAEADLVVQRKNKNLWERRARALGWKDEEEEDALRESKVGDLNKPNSATESQISLS